MTSLCGFKKNMKEIMKKITQIATDRGNFGHWHFQIYLCSIFFVMGELHQLFIDSICARFKAAPWDDINFRFLFCNEVVYPPDHDFI